MWLIKLIKREIFNLKHKDTRPITDPIILKNFLKHLREDSSMGERNYAIFQTGKATLLRVSDVLALKKK